MITPVSLPQPLIPLHAPKASLEKVGGKGLNLAKLAQAGFPVPNAFLIPTECYWEYIDENNLREIVRAHLTGLNAASPADLEKTSKSIREAFEKGIVPSHLVFALEIGYPWLGARPVAVRSSATAEDLPEMSFAGQQDTFLNVIGTEALLDAVVKCWSSLWTARAIGYRARNGISHEDVALSVVVQNMVPAEASGVLFTANPLTGKRDEIVIDATLGLGEALVGGHVEPDHYVVGATDAIPTSGATHPKEGEPYLAQGLDVTDAIPSPPGATHPKEGEPYLAKGLGATDAIPTSGATHPKEGEPYLAQGLGVTDAIPTSGATHPKEGASHLITHKYLGAKEVRITGKAGGGVSVQEEDGSHQQALPDEVILQLAEMGRRIAEMYEFPQDVEWAWVTGASGATGPIPSSPGATHPKEGASHLAGELYILQSRPITTLFPLPEGLPFEPLKAMIGFHVVQGILEPMTPLGRQTMKHVLTGGALAFGADYTDENQTAFYTAAERIWINITGIIRHPLGHKAYPRVIKSIDPAVGQIFERLIDDPRLAPVPQHPKPGTIFNLLKFVIPFFGRIIKYWLRPQKGAHNFFALMEEEVAKIKALSQGGDGLWDRFRTHLKLWQDSRFLFPYTVVPHGVSAVMAGMVPFFGILQRFSSQTGHPQRYLEIARGLPNNVTTEMDLILWETAQTIRADTAAYQAFTNTSAQQLAEEYLNKELPPAAQKAVEKFMSRYGMRGLGEIDLGRPRWREEPFHVTQTLQSYLSITDPDQAPDVVFARGAEAARKAGKELISDVRRLRLGWFKSRLVRWAVSRYRPLAGLREAPKFFAIRVMGVIRQGLLESGRALFEAGLLEKPDDLFFLYAPELEEAAEKEVITTAMRESIKERREARAREMKRKQLPRVLLSDGRAFFEGFQTKNGDADSIVGDPVSPGVVEGKVRVVLNPHETQLLPGEILVCPGTDPAWTPLFLAAGGLVMEVGGMMTHGSVVAREYGIPAVVGVHEATTRLKTGQRVRVDGSTGRVLILDGGD